MHNTVRSYCWPRARPVLVYGRVLTDPPTALILLGGMDTHFRLGWEEGRGVEWKREEGKRAGAWLIACAANGGEGFRRLLPL